MKTLLKVLGIIIGILLLLAILIPVVFKGKIVELVKTEINKNLDAKVDFSGFNLSLIRNFPNLQLTVKGLTIEGVDLFEGDTLADIRSIRITIDLMSAIRGDSYEIKRIRINQPVIVVKVLETGEVNYDIISYSEEDDEPVTEIPDEASPFKLTLKRVEITDGTLVYDDAELDTYVLLRGLNHSLSGDMTQDQTTLRTKTTAAGLTVNYEDVNYLSDVKMVYIADIVADLNNSVYTLSDNELLLNEMALQFDGSVTLPEEGYLLDLTFNAPKTDFKNLLSIIPAIYAKDFASIQTSGVLALNGFIKGVYSDDSLPPFELNLQVDDGMFRYPDLPQSVSNITIRSKIASAGGDADNTVIDVSRFTMNLGNDPFEMTLLLKTPVSDPDLKAEVKGSIDLGGISEFYPLDEGDEMSGRFVMDVLLKGRLSSIENERYDEFVASGNMTIQGFEYKTSALNNPLQIERARMNFSPQFLELTEFSMKTGRNDLAATGRIDNYLGYALKDETLRGKFSVTSEFLSVNDFMSPAGEAEQPKPADEPDESLSVVEIPEKIDFEISSTFKRVVYSNIEMDNVTGRMFVRDQSLILDELRMNLLDGEMAMKGSYSTTVPESPQVDFVFAMKEIDIQKAYEAFDVISVYAPIAAKANGKLSTDFNMNSVLDNEMTLVYETMSGGGELRTSAISIEGVNTLDKIADVLKADQFRKMIIDQIRIRFRFEDGKVITEPFDLNFNKLTSEISGWTSFDQRIDYVMNLNLPRKELGQAANDVLSNLVSQANLKGAGITLGDMISLNVLIGGTISDPTVSTDLAQTGKGLVDDLKDQITDKIMDKKEEITQEIRDRAQKIINDANAQAQKLIDEAEKQTAQIRKTASETAALIRQEADNQAANMEEEGKKKGIIAETIAKEAASKVRDEGNRNADNVIKEGDRQADALMKKANDETDRIRQAAQNEANKLLEGN